PSSTAGILIQNGKVQIVGSTFINNNGWPSAQQIDVQGSAAATLTNTVVWGSASGTMVGKGSSATLTTNYCLVKGQTLTGTGNLAGTIDPKLRSDLHLRVDSPLRAAGGTVAQSRLDWDGELRPTFALDIGVDEFLDVDVDGLPDSWEVATAGNITTIAGAADADNDGLTNTLEYTYETNSLV